MRQIFPRLSRPSPESLQDKAENCRLDEIPENRFDLSPGETGNRSDESNYGKIRTFYGCKQPKLRFGRYFSTLIEEGS